MHLKIWTYHDVVRGRVEHKEGEDHHGEHGGEADEASSRVLGVELVPLEVIANPVTELAVKALHDTPHQYQDLQLSEWVNEIQLRLDEVTKIRRAHRTSDTPEAKRENFNLPPNTRQ